MKKINIALATGFALLLLSFQSCLEFDDPGDEFNSITHNVDKVTNRGDVDSLKYREAINADSANVAFDKMNSLLMAGIGGQFAMRGGKDGAAPGEHQYQSQYSLGVDNYAEYSVIPHTYFPYSKIRISSSYALDVNAYGGAWGAFSIVNQFFTPILNSPAVDNIPEVKAAYLTLYNFSASEVADVYGPMAYSDLKTNLQVGPFTYEKCEDIYDAIFANLDSCVACFKYFDQKPEDYKNVILNKFPQLFMIMGFQGGTDGGNLDRWVRLANSLKLRLAMHIVKYDPTRAKQLAEEAVASGVIENTSQQASIQPSMIGFTNPLLQIQTWGDIRMSAEMEIILKSLNHPWLKYLFNTNSNPIKNNATGQITAANSIICGIRTGTHCGEGQGYDENQYIAFSTLKDQYVAMAPLYIMKYSEVCFLRAEGALRGWNMGGTAKTFYEEGIRAGNIEDVEMKSRDGIGPDGESGVNWYDAWIDQYMEQTSATPFVYHDPTGDTPDIESPIKIGVKWDDGADRETHLEQIITQKWLADYPNGFEAWVDLRRTGYPRILPVLNIDEADGSLVDGDIMRRLPFPGTQDIATKQDVENTGLPALGGPDQMATRLFWDVAGSNF